MEIHQEEHDFQISEGMEYPPSFKEREPETIESEIPKEKSLPHFGIHQNKLVTDKPIPIISKKIISSKDQKDSSSKKKSESEINSQNSQYNQFLEESFSKLRNINTQMASLQQKNKISEKSDNMLEQYKHLSYAYSNSQQKILELEESLKLETLTCEEQRAYIEILKEALDSKINDLGMMNFIKETAKYSQINHIDFFVHLQNLKNDIDQKYSEKDKWELKIQNLEDINDNLQNELTQLKVTNQELIEFNEKINGDIGHTVKNVNLIDEENQKLKMEKNGLLDYIEEITEKMEKYVKKIDELNEKINEKDKIISILKEKPYNRESEPQEKPLIYKQITDNKPLNHNNINNINEDLKPENDALKQKILNLTKINDDLTKKLKINDDLNNENTVKLTNEIKELTTDKDKLNSLLEDLLNNNENKPDDINKLVIDNLKNEIETYKKKLENINKDNNLIKKNNNLDENNDLKDKIDDLRNRLEREREQKSKEIKEIYDNLSQSRSDMRICKEENNNLKLKIENLEIDIKNSHELLDKKQKNFDLEISELKDLKINLEAKNLEISNQIKKNNNLKTEINELQNMLDNWEKQIQIYSNEKDNFLKDINKLDEENTKLKQNYKEISYKYEEERKKTTENNDKVKELENKLRNLMNGLKNLGNGFNFVKKIGKSSFRIQKNEDEPINFFDEFTREIKENFTVLTEENEKSQKNLKDFQEKFNQIQENLTKREKDNDDLKSENKDLYTDLKKLSNENNYLKNEISTLKSENNNLIIQLNQKQSLEDEQLSNQINILERKLIDITLEKNQYEFLFGISCRFLFNTEILELLDELKNVLKTFNSYEKKKINLEKELEEIKFDDLKTGINIRKKEDLKDQLAETENNIKIQESKREILEQELLKLENLENGRYNNINNLEKLQNQLRNEIHLLKNELDMKEVARKNLDNAFQDLLKDYKRISEDNTYKSDKSFTNDYKEKREYFKKTEKIISSSNDFRNWNNDDLNKNESYNNFIYNTRIEKKYKNYE